MAYGKKKLLGECARMKWRKREDTPTAEKLRMMEEVWDALNAWVMERLNAGKVNLVTSTRTLWMLCPRAADVTLTPRMLLSWMLILIILDYLAILPPVSQSHLPS